MAINSRGHDARARASHEVSLKLKPTGTLVPDAMSRINDDSATSKGHGGFRRAPRRNLIPSARYGAPCTGPVLSGNIVPSTVAQLVCAADALARGMRPPRKWECLDGRGTLLEPELAAHSGRVVAFEPDGESFTQYFFVGREDFAAAGLRPEVAGAIGKRVENFGGSVSGCGGAGTS